MLIRSVKNPGICAIERILTFVTVAFSKNYFCLSGSSGLKIATTKKHQCIINSIASTIKINCQKRKRSQPKLLWS